MAEVRARNMPTYESLHEWLTDPLVTALTAAGLLPHYSDQGATDTTTVASDLATSKTLTLSLANSFIAHGADTDIHSAADAALDLPAEFTSHPAEPADLTEVQAVLNQLKADLNTHIANATPHRGVGGEAGLTVSAVSTADATNQATANALANALQVALNRHVAMGYPDIVVD